MCSAGRESGRRYQIVRCASLSILKKHRNNDLHIRYGAVHVCLQAHARAHTHTRAHTVGEGASLCSPAVLSDCSVCWATAAVIPPFPLQPSPLLPAHAGLHINALSRTHKHSHVHTLCLILSFFSSHPSLLHPPPLPFPPSLTAVSTP